jgi:hypothetical protein
MLGESWIEEPELVKGMVKNHFEWLFSKTEWSPPKLSGVSFNI